VTIAGCGGGRAVHAARSALPPTSTTTLALSDALEARIADGTATTADREESYELAQRLPAQTAGDAFGRAALAGRLAEAKGALSILGSHSPVSLVAEAEKYARLSRKIDPEFRQGAATRMLGTLYVLAPANMLEAGDSETGLELLEGLAKKYPENVDNWLRLAEAFVALGDEDEARIPLCRAIAGSASLRRDHRALLETLRSEIESLRCDDVTLPPAASTPSPPARPVSPSPAHS
jgi:hypothetical protein